MKKTIAALLTVFLLLALMPAAMAVSEELIPDGGFEEGKTGVFQVYGPLCDLKVEQGDAQEGQNYLSVTGRAGQYSTVRVDLTDTLALGGPGTYEFTFWLKLSQNETDKHEAQLVVNYALEGGQDQYLISAAKSLNGEWKKFTLKKELPFDTATAGHVWLYPQVIGKTNADFCLDGVSVVKHGELNGEKRETDPEEKPKEASEELLENGDFETDYWNTDEAEDSLFYPYGPTNTLLWDQKYAHSGKGGLCVDERAGQYSTLAYDVAEIIEDGGTGVYRLSMWARLEHEEKGDTTIILVFNYRKFRGGVKYIVTQPVNLTTSWQRLVLSATIDFEPMEIMIYPQVIGPGNPSFCVDDVSLVKMGVLGENELEIAPDDPKNDLDPTVIENLPEPNMKKYDVTGQPREALTVGAIRWDAWYGHQKDAWDICNQVEKTLSPAKYHFRAPFFALVNDAGGITFPAYTQEIFDREMDLAAEAGIDYFVYNWYNDSMRTARDLHTTSEKRSTVKFCALLNGNSSDQTKIEMAELLQQDYYMTVLGGRPLMYYFGDAEPVKNDIRFFRALCQKLELPAPFAVVLNIGADQTVATGADAISNYAISGTDGQSFASLAEENEAKWNGYKRSGLQVVPNVTAGWHSVTRYENPVTWLTVNEHSYAEYATPAEIAQHLTNAFSFMNEEAPDKTVVNTVLVYAWNEHDEGGWICPTIAVDENGNQLFEADGTPKMDRSRLDAFGAAVKEAKTKYAPVDSPAPTEAETTAEPGKEPDGKRLPWWPFAAGGGVLVLAGAGILVAAKKKKEKQHEEA